jgi:hypothetical protein
VNATFVDFEGSSSGSARPCKEVATPGAQETDAAASAQDAKATKMDVLTQKSTIMRL